MMRLSKREDQFNNAVSLFSEETVSKKIAAIISFKSFLHDNDSIKTDQIFQLLINSLAIDQDPALTSVVLDFFRYASFDKINNQVLLETVTTIVKLNRTANRELSKYDFQPSQKNEQENIKAKRLASCLELFIKKGVIPKDLSNLYLDYLDFSGITFDEGTLFDNSILSASKFNHSVCKKCSFVNSDLSGTSFIGANLERSNFKSEIAINLILKDYLEDHMEIPSIFDSATLTSSDFSGFPILFAPSKEDTSSIVVHCSFRAAILDDVNFKTSLMAGPFSRKIGREPKLLQNASAWVLVEKFGNFINYKDSISMYTVNLDSFDLKLLNTLPHFSKLRQEDLNRMMANSFYGSTLFNSKLPPILYTFMKSVIDKAYHH